MEMKIGLFIPTLSGGGAQRVALNLAQGLVGHGCDVNLVLVKREGELRNSIPPGVEVVDLKAIRTLTSIPKLALHLRRAQYDALISFMNYANICAVVASWLSGAPHKLIVTEHTTISQNLRGLSKVERIVRSKLIEHLYPSADHITAVSEGAADDLECTAKLNNVHAIPNPIFVGETDYAAIEPQGVHPWFAGVEPVLLGAGRLTKLKGFDILIRSVRQIQDEGVAVRLIIIGEGEERERLERLTRELDLEKYVELPGFVDNPHEFMRAADVFILSSLWEGFGNVLVEAMACGTPVVSTDCPNGPSEILEGGKWGELVPILDERAMARAVIRILHNQCTNTHDVKERARDYIPQRIAAKYLDLARGRT